MNVDMQYKRYILLILIVIATNLQAATKVTADTDILTNIEIVGNQKQTKDTILLKAGLNYGDNLSNIDLTEALNNLWATELYDDIKLEVSSDGTGKKITVILKERPTIKAVRYLGGKRIGIATIKERVKDSGLVVNANSTYSLESIRKIKNIIMDLASSKGFTNSRVNIIIEPAGPSVSHLIFDIKANGKAKIKQIVLQGNQAISTDGLESVIKKTHKNWPWSSNLLIKKNIEEDIENIKQAYWKKGYKDVLVGEPIIETITIKPDGSKRANVNPNANEVSSEHGRSVKLTIPIVEGPYFNKGTFKVEGDDKDLNKQKIDNLYQNEIIKDQLRSHSWLMRTLNLKKHVKNSLSKKLNPFDLHAVNSVIDNIAASYNDQGYIACHIQKQLEITDGPDGKIVNTIFNINKGKQFRVRHINFEGNLKTKDKVLRRSMIVEEGNVFNVNKLRDSLIRLSQLGYFKIKQDPKCEPLADISAVDITIRGEESGNNTLMFKGGYGSSQGFSIGGSVFTDNLNGSGQSLGISLDTSKSNRILSIDYTEPFFHDTPYSLTTSIFSEYINSETHKKIVTNGDKRHKHGIGVSGQTKLSTFLPTHNWAHFTTCSAGYQFRIERIKASQNGCASRRDDQWQPKSSLIQSLTYSTINHPFRPTNGQSIGAKFEYGGWQFSNGTPFFKTSIDYKKLVAITNRSTFYFYAGCGYIKTKKTDDRYYDYVDLYRPGGENSIRGFEEQSVGPTSTDCKQRRIFIGGNRQLVMNLEYQFRLTDIVQLVMFHDLGQAWARDTSIHRQCPRFSAGVELRLFLPISQVPIRFIWARKLNRYPFDNESRGNFQFSIGTSI